MAYRSALEALADPTRRQVFERLRPGPLPVGRLAHGMTVSRPAVSQHLRVLKEAGLVTEEQDGTRRIYRIDPRGSVSCAPGSINSGRALSTRSRLKSKKRQGTN